jgi:hypothetical protein
LFRAFDLQAIMGRPIAIRLTISERFGRLFLVGETGRAFANQAQAETYGRKKTAMIRITTLIVASLTTIATTSAFAIDSLCEAVAE